MQGVERLTSPININTRTRRITGSEYVVVVAFVGTHYIGRGHAFNTQDVDRHVLILWHECLAYMVKHDPKVAALPAQHLIHFLNQPVNPACIIDYDKLGEEYERNDGDSRH